MAHALELPGGFTGITRGECPRYSPLGEAIKPAHHSLGVAWVLMFLVEIVKHG
jgi:hypothetical protein